MNQRFLDDLAHDLNVVSCQGEQLGDVISITAKLISTEKAKNEEGLQRLSERIGVDVKTPLGELAAALTLTVKTLKALNQCQDGEGTRGHVLEALIVAILQRMLHGPVN